MAETLFYLLSIGAVVSACGVVTARNPLFSVLSLLGALFCLAIIYLLCGFQFLAATQLLVYAGAIMVLFLFVVMLLNLGDPEQYSGRRDLPLGRIAAAGACAGLLALVSLLSIGFGELVAGEPAPTAWPEEGIDDLSAIARLLFSRYVLAFEASSLLLLATMVAVLLLAKRQRPEKGSLGWPWSKGARL